MEEVTPTPCHQEAVGRSCACSVPQAAVGQTRASSLPPGSTWQISRGRSLPPGISHQPIDRPAVSPTASQRKKGCQTLAAFPPVSVCSNKCMCVPACMALASSVKSESTFHQDVHCPVDTIEVGLIDQQWMSRAATPPQTTIYTSNCLLVRAIRHGISQLNNK